MLTYTPSEKRLLSAPVRESVWLLLLLVFAWLWPGVFSHDLWNPAEPQVFAVLSESVGKTVWLPTVLGEPYFKIAPFYIVLAKFWQWLLSPWAADTYSAARFASVSFMAIGLTASGMAAYRLFGRYCGRSTVLILIGSAGLLGMGHFLGQMSVVFAATALCLWGISVLLRQVAWGIVLAGTGAVLFGQTLGWLTALLVPVIVLAVYVFSDERSKRLLIGCVGICVWSLPWLAVQLTVLTKTDATAVSLYVNHHIFGVWGGLAAINWQFSVHYYLQHMLWFAFPAWPLAVWTVIRMRFRKHWGGVAIWIWCSVFGVWLALNPDHFQDNLVVLLVPLAVMGSVKLDDLRRGVAAFLNWFGIMTFGLAAVFLWLGFFAMNFGFPAKLAERAAYFSPDYVRDINPMPMLVASLFTPLWIWAITRKRIRGRQAVTNWAAGMTLVWALLMTLFLPWLDAAKSYRPVVEKMQAAFPKFAQQALEQRQSCVYIAPEFEAARLAWRQYAALPVSADPNCAYHIIQYHPQHLPDTQGQTVLWQGGRPRNKTEAFMLIQR